MLKNLEKLKKTEENWKLIKIIQVFWKKDKKNWRKIRKIWEI